MQELRTELASRDVYVRRVNETQRADGYRLVAVFREGAPDALAVAGFRVGNNLAWGRFLYCDDLSTQASARGQGLGGALVDWMIAEGRRLGCDSFHLDSGVGPSRWDAHRLYMTKGLTITSHHFALPL
jgi:GNAT superfamily N-acetyltransferase